MYRLSVSICFLFASLVIALFTLIMSDTSFQTTTDRGATLVQDLTAVRIWIVVAGLALYSWKSATNQPSALVVTVLTAVAWIMFLEDYTVLDSVLFQSSHPLAQAVVFTRPVFLVALTYVAFKNGRLI
jgi:peptidoglycan/LPS O-acetylase OafA/YrhL